MTLAAWGHTLGERVEAWDVRHAAYRPAVVLRDASFRHPADDTERDCAEVLFADGETAVVYVSQMRARSPKGDAR